jgi:ribonuclease Z
MMLKPRHAIAYHTFDDSDIAPDTIAAIRQTYDGPLTLASDLLVWNVNADAISVRRVIATDAPLPAKPPGPAGPPDPSKRTEASDRIRAGRINLLD